ncbi:hypothetical protein BC937DRAFT_95092 [Endogone sp. FLAS-F59071]|nr:hypothetical protein BC937DRAFT_95092 [Endogone sp. FLAS-F59071]|eukprot:RUS20491.1 hypothetical protein BC937DRAFT_95092 [Endogone sp. FLAS-F59071]
MSSNEEIIPIIDFSLFNTDPAQCAEHIKRASESIGFFYLVNHGIPQQEIDSMFELSKEFFNLSEDEKRRYLIGPNNIGYSAMFQERLDPGTQKKGDHKEAWNFGKFINGVAASELPAVFQNRVEDVARFSKLGHNLCNQILQSFAIGLQIPESEGSKDWFVSRNVYDKPSGDILRFLKYPKGDEQTHGEFVRAGSHTDYGSLTLLFQHQTPGLEVQASRTHWISAPLVPGAILVNIGDLMEFWTAGLFKSTRHRVVFLPEHATTDRYSIAMFCHANDAVPLEVVPSPVLAGRERTGKVITAGEHLTSRLTETYTYY